ncbi:anti-sigma factor [Paenibacillus sambharensis]|uniref:Anti-sigma-W factor RsiW n=1 Tax=Paenibacillus sambharensis TaxID=1803190 RepID=A0A2W1LQS7_9BACL|nr:zf-HC2 domain-containing protein [Paenibacillus sambharensis]PZD96864.1 anti-sigma factor [Paenibacillus sambharensis]
MNCNVATSWIHDYLDGELPREEAIQLKAHLLACPACRSRFEQLERTEAYVQAAFSADTRSLAGSEAYNAAALTDRIMGTLPAAPQKRSWTRWLRNHPAIAVASVFAMVMLSSFITMWEQHGELVVRGTDLDQVVITGNRVIVPEGARVSGDLTVENGITEVAGEIQGNLTVIDGTLNMASTAKIIGEEKTINQALDWVWYKLKRTVNDLAS